MLEIRKTIHEAEKVYDTGARPILVTCDDEKDWVCKHDEGTKLVREIIGSKFAEVWNINTPEICLLEVKEEHIPQQQIGLQLQLINFKKLCFGSLFLKHCQQIDYTSTLLFKDKGFRDKVKSKEKFLKIALFDIWLSNEDRNGNNSNLFIDISDPTDYQFCVFDHGEIFNSGNLKNLCQITEEDSIINTDLTNILFKKGKKLTTIVNNIVENFYLCASECEKALTEIISLIPEQWGIDIESLELNIRKNLFNEAWLKECENSFRAFIQIKIQNK